MKAHRRNVNNPFANRGQRNVGHSDIRYGGPHNQYRHEHRSKRSSRVSFIYALLVFFAVVFYLCGYSSTSTSPEYSVHYKDAANRAQVPKSTPNDSPVDYDSRGKIYEESQKNLGLGHGGMGFHGNKLQSGGDNQNLGGIYEKGTYLKSKNTLDGKDGFGIDTNENNGSELGENSGDYRDNVMKQYNAPNDDIKVNGYDQDKSGATPDDDGAMKVDESDENGQSGNLPNLELDASSDADRSGDYDNNKLNLDSSNDFNAINVSDNDDTSKVLKTSTDEHERQGSPDTAEDNNSNEDFDPDNDNDSDESLKVLKAGNVEYGVRGSKLALVEKNQENAFGTSELKTKNVTSSTNATNAQNVAGNANSYSQNLTSSANTTAIQSDGDSGQVKATKTVVDPENELFAQPNSEALLNSSEVKDIISVNITNLTAITPGEHNNIVQPQANASQAIANITTIQSDGDSIQVKATKTAVVPGNELLAQPNSQTLVNSSEVKDLVPVNATNVIAITSGEPNDNVQDAVPVNTTNLTAITSGEPNGNVQDAVPVNTTNLTAITSGEPNDNVQDVVPMNTTNLTAITSGEPNDNVQDAVPVNTTNLTAITSGEPNDNVQDVVPVNITNLNAITSGEPNNIVQLQANASQVIDVKLNKTTSAEGSKVDLAAPDEAQVHQASEVVPERTSSPTQGSSAASEKVEEDNNAAPTVPDKANNPSTAEGQDNAIIPNGNLRGSVQR